MSVNLLGEYIREARKKKGYSLRTVAEKAQISPAQLSKIENGLIKSSPKDETLENLAYALNVDRFGLFSLVGRIPKSNATGQLGLLPWTQRDKELYEYHQSIGVSELYASYEIEENPEYEFNDMARKLVALKDPDLAEEDIEFMVNEIGAMYKIAKQSLRNRKKMNGGDE